MTFPQEECSSYLHTFAFSNDLAQREHYVPLNPDQNLEANVNAELEPEASIHTQTGLKATMYINL